MIQVLAKPKAYRCPGCKPENLLRQIVLVHALTFSSRADLAAWDGTVTLDCSKHGQFIANIDGSPDA